MLSLSKLKTPTAGKTITQVFDMRAEGCTDEDAWLEVLSADLRLTMPITPYRSFNPADVVNNRRVLLGVDGEGATVTLQKRL